MINLAGESLIGAIGLIALQFVSPWIALTIFGFGIFLAGYFVWHAEYSKNIPRFDVSRYLIKEREIMYPTLNAKSKGKFVQLAPTCLTDAAVDNCRATLIQVYRQKPDSKWGDTGVNDACSLLWASQDDSVSAIRLEPNAEAVINLCNTDAINFKLNIPRPSVPINADLNLGTFSFDMKFTGDNSAPVYRSLEVTVSGNWENVSCILWNRLTLDKEKKRLM